MYHRRRRRAGGGAHPHHEKMEQNNRTKRQNPVKGNLQDKKNAIQHGLVLYQIDSFNVVKQNICLFRHTKQTKCYKNAARDKKIAELNQPPDVKR